MPGLLDDEGLLQLLASSGLLSGGSTAGAGAALPGGLLSPAWRPDPNEGLMTKFFGNAKNPNDPRSDAMMALGLGLMRHDPAAGFAAANNTFREYEDRGVKRTANNLALTKGALEVGQMADTMRRNQAIRAEMQRQQQGQAGAVSAPGVAGAAPGLSGASDQFGTPNVGGVPMFSMDGASPASIRVPQSGLPQMEGQSGGGLPQPGSASAVGTGGNQTQAIANRLIQQAQVYSKFGDFETANKLLEQAAKFRPKFSTTPQIMRDPRTGNLVQVTLNEDGGYQILPFGVKPDISMQDLGGSVRAIDKNALSNGDSFGKTPTYADRVAAGNLDVSRKRLALDENSPSYMQTEDGIVALPKRPAAGTPLIGQPVTGPNGEVLTKPLKSIPPAVNAAMIENRQTLNRLTRALTLINGNDIGDPANGGQTGDRNATGVKAYFPDAILNRLDEKGIDARAEIADIGSQKIHDRSGAAVTISESPRLMPFVPQATDSRKAVVQKLQRLRNEVASEAGMLEQTYGREMGYRPSPMAGAQPQQPQQAPGQAMDKLPTANASNRGRKIRDNVTGKTLQSDGLQWKEVR